MHKEATENEENTVIPMQERLNMYASQSELESVQVNFEDDVKKPWLTSYQIHSRFKNFWNYIFYYIAKQRHLI